MIRETPPAKEPAIRAFYSDDMSGFRLLNSYLTPSVIVKTIVLYGVTPTTGETRPLKNPRIPSPLNVSRHVLVKLGPCSICMRTLIVSKGCPITVPMMFVKEEIATWYAKKCMDIWKAFFDSPTLLITSSASDSTCLPHQVQGPVHSR